MASSRRQSKYLAGEMVGTLFSVQPTTAQLTATDDDFDDDDDDALFTCVGRSAGVCVRLSERHTTAAVRGSAAAPSSPTPLAR